MASAYSKTANLSPDFCNFVGADFTPPWYDAAMKTKQPGQEKAERSMSNNRSEIQYVHGEKNEKIAFIK